MTPYEPTFDHDLVLRFVIEFSRFEYALKRVGCLKKGVEEAQPDWDSFAAQMRGRLATTSTPVTAAFRCLLSAPPRKQVVLEGGLLGWRNSNKGPGETEEAFLLRLVRTVRNNLFHGGKFPYPEGPVEEIARDRQLLEAALIVLQECRQVRDDLNAIFLEAA